MHSISHVNSKNIILRFLLRKKISVVLELFAKYEENFKCCKRIFLICLLGNHMRCHPTHKKKKKLEDFYLDSSFEERKKKHRTLNKPVAIK